MQETPEITNQSEASPEGSAQTDPSTDLEQRLRQAEQAAQEHHEAWLRARADCDNVRKRSQTEIANAHKFAVENFVSELVPVKDSLEAALASDNATVESMRAGVELTLRQLKSVFEKFNVKEIDPAGEKFDPHRHQAISTVQADVEPNTVVQVLQKGYLLHDRVIRPALVTVAQAPNR
jgi:molecular chaperone GrpE